MPVIVRVGVSIATSNSSSSAVSENPEPPYFIACAGTAASLIDQFWRRSAQDQMKYVSCPVEYPPPSVAIWTWSK